MAVTGREVLLRSVRQIIMPDTWSYIFTHHTRVNVVQRIVPEEFPTFVHTSLVYKKVDKRIVSQERPTVSGLLFIQGEPVDIQKSLREALPGLYLVKDPATNRPAIIPDDEMQPFMRIASTGQREVRYMMHPLADYADGRARIRVTEGILAGMEGYVVRLNRDRFLVTRMGNLTIAISGIHRDSFVNVDEYAAERRMQQSHALQYLFVPQTDVDVHALEQLLAQSDINGQVNGQLLAELPLATALAPAGLDLRPLRRYLRP